MGVTITACRHVNGALPEIAKYLDMEFFEGRLSRVSRKTMPKRTVGTASDAVSTSANPAAIDRPTPTPRPLPNFTPLPRAEAPGNIKSATGIRFDGSSSKPEPSGCKGSESLRSSSHSGGSIVGHAEMDGEDLISEGSSYGRGGGGSEKGGLKSEGMYRPDGANGGSDSGSDSSQTIRILL